MKNKVVEKALETIEGQLYAINARNISMNWIGLNKTPTREEISNLNNLLAFIIAEIRELKETGKLDVEKLKKKYYEK